MRMLWTKVLFYKTRLNEATQDPLSLWDQRPPFEIKLDDYKSVNCSCNNAWNVSSQDRLKVEKGLILLINYFYPHPPPSFSLTYILSTLTWTVTQCDQIGRFLKVRGCKVPCAKVAQIFINIFRLLCKMAFFMLNWCGYFLGSFWRKLGCFLLQHLVTLLSLPSDCVCVLCAAVYRRNILRVRG